jgi:hypothetical protein
MPSQLLVGLSEMNNESSLLGNQDVSTNSVHSQQGPPAGDTRKALWQRFLESSGGAALVTVLIGGCFGQYISCSIQRHQKDREFAQGILKAQSDQDILTHSEYLRQELEIVKQVHDLIGSCIAASEDLIALTGREFVIDPEKYDKEELEHLRSQRKSMVDNYNLRTTQWRAEHERLGLLMNYYHRGKADLDQPWSDLEQSVTKYINCAKDWYNDHQIPSDNSSACVSSSDDLKKNLRSLQSKLESTSQFGASERESLKKLRSELEE